MQQYLYAAAPFAAIVLYLILIFTERQKKEERQEQRRAGKKPQGRVSYLTEGATVGMLLGVAVSSMDIVGTAISLWVGLILGAAAGVLITKKED